MDKIEYCYQNGDLAKAMIEAAEFIKKIGENKVQHVFSREDVDVPGAWWVIVVYYAD